MESLLAARREVGVSKHCNISHLNTPSIFESKNGDVGCVIRLKGFIAGVKLNEEINSAKRAWHHSLCQLPEECAVQVQVLRKKADINLSGLFSDRFSTQLDAKYHEQFQDRDLYQNHIYLIILQRGMGVNSKIQLQGWASHLNFGLLNKIEKQDVSRLAQARKNFRNQLVLKLNKNVAQLMTSLARFGPEKLGEQDENLGYSELLEFLSRPLNALKDFKYKSPINFRSPEDLYPRMNLSCYLPQMRLFFGEVVEFHGADGKIFYAKCLSIKTYSSETHALILSPLRTLEAEFLQVHGFYFEPMGRAQKSISRQRVKLENANDPAKSQIFALTDLKDDLASGRVKTGRYHHSLMIVAETYEALTNAVTEAVKFYNHAGIGVIEESIGLEPVFWSQLVTNQKYIIRDQVITTANFTDFCPLHNDETGYKNKNHLGRALTLVQTAAKTPLFFNYHSAGSGRPNDLTPGHTTVIGGNGSGKTVFLGFMDAQMGRYGGQTFIFDRDHGLEIYVRATGGAYLSIAPAHPSETNLEDRQGSSCQAKVYLNPFRLSDTPENRLFLTAWLAELIKEEDERSLSADIMTLLSDCVNYAYEVIPPNQRTLSTAAQWLPIDFPRWHLLYRWMGASGLRSAGSYAYLFDHTEDLLALNAHKVGFDLTFLMSQPKSVLTPVMMYLFHRIEEILTGQRVSILLDEGWMYLDHPYWQDKLKQWLPTLRKRNCHIVLATQSPESIVNSPISAVFFDNTATQIFFCNERANYKKHYQYFNITESEFEFIKKTPREKRWFLYKQGQESVIAQLNLNGLEEALSVFSGNTQSVALLRKILEYADPDPTVWLPIFLKEYSVLKGSKDFKVSQASERISHTTCHTNSPSITRPLSQ